MKKQNFKIEGFEILQKDVKHYKDQASRVIVPVTWKKVAIVRLE